MNEFAHSGGRRPSTMLRRLAKDNTGNTLAMMAAMMVPMAALAGSTIDTARLYLVKVRLQQACDAGALAGRRYMVDSASPTLDANTVTQATNFFNNNFKSGWLATTNVTFTPTKTANNRVAGTASARVPMALMRIFGFTTQTVSVTCEARFDIADTDIIFVLDTTGSMACLPSDDNPTCNSYVNSAGTTSYTRPADSALGSGSGSMNDSVPGYPGTTAYYVPEKAGSRIAALRQAVVDFYNTLAANVLPGTNIRYGFVTYTSTVNAGKAIMGVNPAYMVGGSGTTGGTTVTYNSRYIDPNNVNSQYASSSSAVYDSSTQTQCNAWVATRSPAAIAGQPYTFDSSSNASVVTKSWDTGVSPARCRVTTTIWRPRWTYGPRAFDVTNYLTQASVDDPTKLDGSTSSWDGCIEERQTTAGATTFDIDALPADLDPDLIPTSDTTRWKPMWTSAVYGRNYNGGSTTFSSTSAVLSPSSNGGDSDNTAYYNNVNAFAYAAYGSGSLLRSGWVSCGKPVRRLAKMTLSDVTNYVNATDFRPIGGTYHDTGMIWGVRMLSPNGIFASDTAAWPGRNPPNRVIVFLTDGDMAPNLSIYGMYGVEYFDRRVTNATFSSQKDMHNARFLAECSKAKNRLNINVWTVTIGSSATTEMQSCATNTSQALFTTSGSDLSDKFKTIALKVAKLRLSQ